TPVITWPSPAAITFGTALGATQLDATASVDGTFAYTPAAGTVLASGTQTLSVTFTPADPANYTRATQSVTIDVLIVPVITWGNPAPITAGTPLGAAQLDATPNVPGAFTYTPAAGTVLAAGSGQTLSVAFTPGDPTTYAAASKSATIDVLLAPTITWADPAPI